MPKRALDRLVLRGSITFFLAYAYELYLYSKPWYQKVATVYLHYYLAMFFRFPVSVHSHPAVQMKRLWAINQVEGITLISSLLPWLPHTLGSGKNTTLRVPIGFSALLLWCWTCIVEGVACRSYMYSLQKPIACTPLPMSRLIVQPKLHSSPVFIFRVLSGSWCIRRKQLSRRDMNTTLCRLLTVTPGGGSALIKLWYGNGPFGMSTFHCSTAGTAQELKNKLKNKDGWSAAASMCDFCCTSCTHIVALTQNSHRAR